MYITPLEKRHLDRLNKSGFGIKRFLFIKKQKKEAKIRRALKKK